MAKLAFLNAGILIVDDELANVRLLEKILQNAGYSNVFSTTNPHEVFPLFVERQPDLILLDLMMPEMNGF
ncbi:MAG: response regulator, partial [Abitibacteriaceae bacterium]|nr:response regulator [Abditibacteriaceae bacterium]